MSLHDPQPTARLTLSEKCIGWGIVLILPPLIPLILVFGFSTLVPPSLEGWDWWAMVLTKMFHFPEPGWLTIGCLLIQMTGLVRVIAGCILGRVRKARAYQ